MKLVQLWSSFAVRHVNQVIVTWLVCLSLSPFVSHALSAQVIPPSKVEVAITPTLQVVPEKLAGSAVWAGGLTASGTYRFHGMLAVEAAVLGAFAPQLNYKKSSTLNSINTSLSAEVHQPHQHQWDPYLGLGIGHASFRYIDPPEGYDRSREYMYKRASAGVRYALNERVNWRAEMSRQFSSVGASNTFMSGVSLRIRQKVKQ